jgi:hypothetical protein
MKIKELIELRLKITFTNLIGAIVSIICVLKTDNYDTFVWAGVTLMLGRAGVEGYKQIMKNK